ncbi:MAG: alkaline phosphatase D family protein [Reyranellaceae bacterium]
MRPRTLLRRRRLLLGGALAVAAPAVQARATPFVFTEDPFSLGVASGAPRPDGVVLWTRLAPQPLDGGGMPDETVTVDWQIAEDDSFSRVAARGEAQAEPALGHSVHVEVRGLAPGRPYWYRFRAGNAASPIGRTRTAPAADARPDRLRFAFASCQQYEQGYYGAWRDMARRDLDLVVHLGDYIYESSWGSPLVRRHGAGIPTTLAEFRTRYALYKSDRDLQAAHAAFPFLAIWDDHEVADDYADDRTYTVRDPGRFLAIRAAAYQAWWEHLPLPLSMRPRGPSATIYDAWRFGDLLELLLLDDRQYRSQPACVNGGRPGIVRDCAERSLEERTMLGAAQEAWLDERLRRASGRWTLVGQQTLMAELQRAGSDGPRYWMDGWDGYPNARRRLLEAIERHRPANPVVIGGDRHAYFVADLALADGRPLASEFVGTSITSQGPTEKALQEAVRANPHIKYARGDRRGFATVELTRAQCSVGFEAVDDVKVETSPVHRLASFVVENGRPGAHTA